MTLNTQALDKKDSKPSAAFPQDSSDEEKGEIQRAWIIFYQSNDKARQRFLEKLPALGRDAIRDSFGCSTLMRVCSLELLAIFVAVIVGVFMSGGSVAFPLITVAAFDVLKIIPPIYDFICERKRRNKMSYFDNDFYKFVSLNTELRLFMCLKTFDGTYLATFKETLTVIIEERLPVYYEYAEETGLVAEALYFDILMELAKSNAFGLSEDIQVCFADDLKAGQF